MKRKVANSKFGVKCSHRGVSKTGTNVTVEKLFGLNIFGVQFGLNSILGQLLAAINGLFINR